MRCGFFICKTMPTSTSVPDAASFHFRLATPADVPALLALIELSVRTLQAQDYSQAQIEGALGTVFGVDSQLIADGTYFVLETMNGGEKKIVGCGGWSKRKTLFGSDHRSGREDSLLDPLRDNAKIRAFFVHPEWARRGIGSQILEACENAASEAGFRGFELGATITGERLYRARRYQAIERIEVSLANGASLPVIRMSKKRLLGRLDS
jgi:GNAT superfamily N-acetyltransferase